MATQGELGWPTRDQLDESQQHLYDEIIGGRSTSQAQPFMLTDPEGRLEGPFNAMLLNVRIGDAMNRLGLSIRYATSLTARETEIGILELARVRSSAFERYAHERVARAVGMSDEEIAGLRGGLEVATFNSREAGIRNLVRRLLAREEIPVSDVRAATKLFTEAGVMEILALAGYYDMLALTLSFWQVPTPHSDVDARKTSDVKRTGAPDATRENVRIK